LGIKLETGMLPACRIVWASITGSTNFALLVYLYVVFENQSTIPDCNEEQPQRWQVLVWECSWFPMSLSVYSRGSK
jgi:hypothetical protein